MPRTAVCENCECIFEPVHDEETWCLECIAASIWETVNADNHASDDCPDHPHVD